MPNTNCLEGMKCPSCGSEGPFNVHISGYMDISDDGTDLHSLGDTEWGDESDISCNGCGAHGKVAGFRTDGEPPEVKAKTDKKRSPFDDDAYDGNDDQIQDLKDLAEILLTALIAAKGNGIKDDPAVWQQIDDAIVACRPRPEDG